MKLGSPDESDDEIEDDEPYDDALVPTPIASDLVDGDLEVPSSSTQSLADHIHALTVRFDANWDQSQEHRVALSQDLDSI